MCVYRAWDRQLAGDCGLDFFVPGTGNRLMLSLGNFSLLQDPRSPQKREKTRGEAQGCLFPATPVSG